MTNYHEEMMDDPTPDPRDEVLAGLDEVPLPCDVGIPINGTIRKGCKLRTLLIALERRGMSTAPRDALTTRAQEPDALEPPHREPLPPMSELDPDGHLYELVKLRTAFDALSRLFLRVREERDRLRAQKGEELDALEKELRERAGTAVGYYDYLFMLYCAKTIRNALGNYGRVDQPDRHYGDFTTRAQEPEPLEMEAKIVDRIADRLIEKGHEEVAVDGDIGPIECLVEWIEEQIADHGSAQEPAEGTAMTPERIAELRNSRAPCMEITNGGVQELLDAYQKLLDAYQKPAEGRVPEVIRESIEELRCSTDENLMKEWPNVGRTIEYMVRAMDRIDAASQPPVQAVPDDREEALWLTAEIIWKHTPRAAVSPDDPRPFGEIPHWVRRKYYHMAEQALSASRPPVQAVPDEAKRKAASAIVWLHRWAVKGGLSEQNAQECLDHCRAIAPIDGEKT